MQLKGFLKRVLPFFLTFSLGLLVASFFVSVAAPSFNFKKRNHRCREYRENSRLQMENQSLREDNEALRRELRENDLKTVPAFELDVPPPPPPPMKVKPNKMVDPTAPAIVR
jgi:hypothetical protein